MNNVLISFQNMHSFIGNPIISCNLQVFTIIIAPIDLSDDDRIYHLQSHTPLQSHLSFLFFTHANLRTKTHRKTKDIMQCQRTTKYRLEKCLFSFINNSILHMSFIGRCTSIIIKRTSLIYLMNGRKHSLTVAKPTNIERSIA